MIEDRMDDIYALGTGDFIDLSNLVTVGEVYFDKWPCFNIELGARLCSF